MKKWMQNLVNQLDINGVDEGMEDEKASSSPSAQFSITEDRATLVYLIDVYSKHLLEIENHPIRKMRETCDSFAKELVNPQKDQLDKILFRFRQFFSSYRIDEYAYVQKTFDEFRNIIWDFVNQLAEDLAAEQVEDQEIQQNLDQLREAVEANSINTLKIQSRHFIDSYIEHQSKREQRRSRRMTAVKKNLSFVKKQLCEANQGMRLDHLTQAFNRKSFDEQMSQQLSIAKLEGSPVTLVAMDIDHFKKFNDTYGHAMGDFILVECVKLLKNLFPRQGDFIARVGGEEFSIVLPNTAANEAVKMAEHALQRIRKEVFIEDGHQLRFTMSMGLAQWMAGESIDQWIKRADEALYHSKNTGRNRYTVASHIQPAGQVA